jgi:hypothetical protein
MPWKKGNRVRLLAEAEAKGATRDTYEQIKSALGLPHVAALHQALAMYPKFFELYWRAFRPVFGNPFFAAIERLRADAYTRAFNYFDVPDLSVIADPNARRELEEATDLLQYEDAAMLLIAAIQLQAFDGSGERLEQLETSAGPVKHPIYVHAPKLSEEQAAPVLLRRVYEDLRHALGTSFISYEYRALARSPEFFARYSAALKEWSTSPIYEGIQHAVRESAWMLACELPAAEDLTVGHLSEIGISNEEIAAVVHISELFIDELSSLVLNVSLARIALEGGTQIRRPAAPGPVKEVTGAEKAA